MSHFTVMIAGHNPEGSLAPFQEDLDVEFKDLTDEYQKEYDEDSIEMVKTPTGEYLYTWDDRFKKPKKSGLDSTKYEYPEGFVKKDFRYNEVHETFEVFCKDYHNASKNSDGRYGYMHNPQAQWDWHALGGRWSGHLILKTGEKADQAFKKDIDFEAMSQDGEDEHRKRYQKVSKLLGGIPMLDFKWSDLRDREDIDINEKRRIYQDQAGKKKVQEVCEKLDQGSDGRSLLAWLEIDDYQCSEEEYAQRGRNSRISTFAFLKDGNWIERGEMGWFGISHNEKDQKKWSNEFDGLLENIAENELISIYDCHI